MIERSMSEKNGQEEEFISQIRMYIQNLEEYKLSIIQNKTQMRKKGINETKYISTLVEKISLEIGKYEQTINKIKTKIMSYGAIKTLKQYINNSYQNIIRTSNLQSKEGVTRQMVRKIKSYEEELEEEWDPNYNTNSKRNSNNKYANNYSNTLLLNKQKGNLQEMAKEQLQKQFLMIRMIAYKMYEQYSTHSHTQLAEQLKSLKDENQKISKQLNQARGNKKQLQEQFRGLCRQVQEMKKVNEIVGRRYFINNQDQTDFISY